MKYRTIAILALLVSIASAVAVISYTETDGAETNDVPDLIYLDDIVGGNYWVKGSTDGSGTMTLTYNEKGAKANLILNVKDGSNLKISKVAASGLTVPEGATLVCGYINEDLKTYGYPLNISGNLKVNGTINGDIVVTKESTTIAFDYATVGDTIEGYSIPCSIYVVKDTKITMSNNTFIGKLYVMKDSRYGITITNAKSNNFTMKYTKYADSDKNIWSLSGLIKKDPTALNSSIELGDDYSERNLNRFTFDNMTLYHMDLILHYKCTSEISVTDNRDAIDYSGGKLICSESNIFKFIRSIDEKQKTMIFNFSNDPSSEGKIVYFTYNKTGPTEAFYEIKAVATEGIASIDKEINLLPLEGEINLSSIKVNCEGGYKFVGWYYLNDAGIMCKITNPSHFTADGSMSIYALADNGSGNNTLFFIVVIILQIALLIVVAVGIYKKK